MPKTKEKKQKVKKTPRQRGRIALKVLAWIVGIIAVIALALAILNTVSAKAERAFVKNSVEAVAYENQLVPTLADDGYYTFVTDEDFKVLQLTDVHLGAGVLSTKKDTMAMNAVAAMVTEEKPDLVIVTGDVSYPIPYSAGSFNNKNPALVFADLMEKLGVYWCLGFGNHDTEAYSYFSRSQLAKLYNDKEKYPHCLFQSGPENIDGVGNYVINVKNTAGKLTQSLFILDSNSYADNDYFGIQWKYDCVHENQVKWYEETAKALQEENGGEVKSLAFFHIPPAEMKEAFAEYKENGEQDTADVQYLYGKIAEGNQLICSSKYNYGLFDAFQANGTQGAFFGHDHLNNMSLLYKGTKLTYGYSIDYLAYFGIAKFGLQRGCTVIYVHPDGSFDNHGENYYQDKYVSINEKETVDLEHDMADVNGGAVNPLAAE